MERAEEIESGWGAERDRLLVMAEEIDLTPSDEEALAAVADRLRRERLEEEAAAARRAEQLRTNLRSVRPAVPEDAPAVATLSGELGYPGHRRRDRAAPRGSPRTWPRSCARRGGRRLGTRPLATHADRDAARLAAGCCDADADVVLVRAVAAAAWELVHGDPARAAVAELFAAVGRAHGADDAAASDACAAGLASGTPAVVHPIVRDLFLELTGRSPAEDDPSFEEWFRRYPGG